MHSSRRWFTAGHFATLLITLAAISLASCDDPSCPDGTAEVSGECKNLDELRGEGNPGGSGNDGAAATTSIQSMDPSQVSPAAGAGVSPDDEAFGGASAPSSAGSPSAASGSGAGSSGAPMSMTQGEAGANPQQPLAGSSGAGGMSGAQPECTSSGEVCDNADNDCDGNIDEAVARSCGPDAVGRCMPGTETCSEGAWSECTGAVMPAGEICDPENLDENCDGIANDGCACAAGETRMCGDADGECEQGTQTCVDGAWAARCDGAVEPKTEVCDQAELDEDCDGMLNEGCDCVNGQTEVCPGNNTAPCAAGMRACSEGQWGACTGVKAPQSEKCDGLDNDCNGTVDDGEDQLCAGSARCAGREGCVSCLGNQDCPASSQDCEESYCNLASHTCQMRARPDRTGCNTGTTDGFCFAGDCLQCLSADDCESAETNECKRAVCVNGACNIVVTDGASCGDGKRCTREGACQLPYYALCSSSDDCPADAPCGTTTSDAPTRCLPTCAQNLMQCDTHTDGNGLCFYMKCLIQCASCTVDENRVRTCTDTNQCPSGMPCLLTGDQMFCQPGV